jgi:hypothetical protein
VTLPARVVVDCATLAGVHSYFTHNDMCSYCSLLMREDHPAADPWWTSAGRCPTERQAAAVA